MRHEEQQRDQDRRWDRESRYGERGRNRNDDWQRRHAQHAETSPWDADEDDNESQRFGDSGEYDDEGGEGRRYRSQGRGSQGGQFGRGGSARGRFGARREQRFGQGSGGYGENNPQIGQQGYDYGQSMYPENDDFMYRQHGQYGRGDQRGQYGQRGGDSYGQGGGQYGQRGQFGQGDYDQHGQYGQGAYDQRYGQGRQGGSEYGGNRVPSNYRWMGNNWERTGGDRQMGQHGGKGPKGYKRSDDRIREDICDRFTDDHELDASNIEVKVQNCEVTLSGTVDDRQLKRLAEDLAEECAGVREVRNEIRVQNGKGRSGSESSDDSSKRQMNEEAGKRQSK